MNPLARFRIRRQERELRHLHERIAKVLGVRYETIRDLSPEMMEVLIREARRVKGGDV